VHWDEKEEETVHGGEAHQFHNGRVTQSSSVAQRRNLWMSRREWRLSERLPCKIL